MGGDQKEQENKKGPFCLVGVYDHEDHIQLRSHHSEEEKDLEMIMEEQDHESSSSSSFDGSARSVSSSSLDMVDASSSSLSTSSQSNGALDDLSELMSHLPIKRGLSKFYQGKSQSFKSLARVTSLEDVVKKESGCRRGYGARMKVCNSYGGGFNLKTTHQQRSPYTASPKTAISKKSPSSPSSSSYLRGKMANRRSFLTIHHLATL